MSVKTLTASQPKPYYNVAIRMTSALADEVRFTAESLGMKHQEVLRHSIKLGLPVLIEAMTGGGK